MASVTILSDNGATSGSAGLKTSGGNDGVLLLQTTTSGGTPTTAISISNTQVVTYTNQPTYTGGTANGVAYLNGSKVLTTGTALVFDGTNLGIGTSAPAAKLHLLTTGNTTADGVRLTFGSEARSHNIYSALPTGRDLTIAPYRSLTINTGSGTNEGIVTLNSYEYTVFGTGSSYTERMRLDASGNLGLGATVNSWVNTWRVLTLGGTSGVGGSLYSNAGAANAQQIGIGANWYYDQSSGNNRRIGAGYAADYYQYNGTHVWSTAASSTAGSTISFTQAMTLDASGNLGVNTTSPQGRVESKTASVVGGDSAYAKKAFVANIPLSTANVVSSLVAGFDGTIHGVDVGYSYDGTGYYLAFATNSTTIGSPTERARIDRSGNLLVGTTSTINSAALTVQKSVSDNVVLFNNTSSSAPYGLQVRYSNLSPNSTGTPFFEAYDNPSSLTLRVAFRSNGGLANYSANNVNLSDRREKTNFAPAGDYLAKICAIPVQTFNYIDQNLEEDAGLTLGVVAQDVQAVAPELVMESNWAGKDEEPKMRLSIYQTDLQYALMKCIQEQQAIITQLQADVAALKGQA